MAEYLKFKIQPKKLTIFVKFLSIQEKAIRKINNK